MSPFNLSLKTVLEEQTTQSWRGLEDNDSPDARGGYGVSQSDGSTVEPVSIKTPNCEILMLESISGFLGSLGKFANFPITDEFICEVEGIVALYITLCGCSTVSAMVSSCVLYARKLVKGSLYNEIKAYISKIFTGSLETQSGNEKSRPQWIDFLRSLKTDWSTIRQNKLFSHFSKLMGLIVTLGLCKASSVTFSLKEYILCEPDLQVLHGNTVDVIEAVFSTINFFVEGLYQCFKQKSLRPLWLGSQESSELDQEFSTILSWWGLLQNGNLEKITSEMGDEIKVVEFDRRLELLLTKLKIMISSTKGFEKNLFTQKFQKMLQIKNDYVTMKISSGIRRAPFCIELFGASSQGKSTFGDQLVDHLLFSQGYSTDKQYRASYNPSDEFMSNWQTNKLVLLLDDMSNEKPQFVQKPPVRALIDICNNTPYYANKAELEAKGKVFVEPVIVMVTTNKKSLDAYTYSNCPYSVQRRMDYVITVRARDAFMRVENGKPQGLDANKVRESYMVNGVYCPRQFDDIWLLTVEKAVQPEALNLEASYKVITWGDIELKDVSSSIVREFLTEQFHLHKLNQDSIINSMNSRSNELVLCEAPGCIHLKGCCTKHDKDIPSSNYSLVDPRTMETHWGFEETREFTSELFSATWNMFNEHGVGPFIEHARNFYELWDWLSFIPTSWVNNRYINAILLFTYQDQIRDYYLQTTIFIWVFVFFIGFNLYIRLDTLIATLLVMGVVAFALYRQRWLHVIILNDINAELLRRNTINYTVRRHREIFIRNVCVSCTFIGFLYAIGKCYGNMRKLTAQGSLEPLTEDEVRLRDEEPNEWTTVVKRELPITSLSKTVTIDVLRGLVDKNLVYGTVCLPHCDRRLMVNGLFITSNVVIIPSHYFEEETLDVTFRKVNPDANGGKFATRLSKKSSYFIPGTDLVACYSSTGGSFRNLTKHLPLANLPQHPFEMLYRSKNGALTLAKGLAVPKCGIETTRPATDYSPSQTFKFDGGHYRTLTINTFKGLCGAVLISDTHGVVISGIHLGGKTDTPEGCYGVLTQDMMNEAMLKLRSQEGVLITGSAEKFEPVVYETQMLVDRPLHYKSALNFMPKNSQVEYYGACSGMSTSISSVRVTPISEHVMEVCNVPNKWGPPKFKPDWFAWSTCMRNISVPALPYPHDLLETAILDYKSALIPVFQRRIWNTCKPLRDVDNINGIAGCKFIDAIKFSTSIGYPLSGPKSKHIIELEPTVEHPVRRDFLPHIWQRINQVEDAYKRGERAYEIAKAQKKDEILSMEKEKCRIFYGNSIALTFLIRKYYLPLVRVLQMNSLKAECAVGINCHGPEWEEFYDHIMQFGTDTVIGGDYGKYDQKLPSQLVLASFRILIDFAKLCNYTKEDLTVMEAMAGDVAYSLIAMNGDLIGLSEGTHISGNSLTVIINGIAGSLNCRCFFYTLYPKDHPMHCAFRDVVALGTYGDDNLGTVDARYCDFNIEGLSQFLGMYGQVYTMPDKEASMRKFLDREQIEFLKRKSVYHPKLGCSVGALVDNSIYKSLHCFMREKKSPHTPEYASAINISGALREWFNHGESKYEIQRSMMKDVSKRAGIDHMVEGLDLTYDDRVDIWKARYIDRTLPFEITPFFDLE